MSDRLEEIRQRLNPASPRAFDFKRWAHDDAPYLLARLAAAERYVIADLAYDNAVGHAEYAGAVAAKNARDAALAEWNAAKGGT